MKKAILTLGLFSMMMILTSFTSPNEIGGSGTPKTGGNDPVLTPLEIGGSGVPKTGGAGIVIGGSGTPKTGGNDPILTTHLEIGGSGVPKTGGGIG